MSRATCTEPGCSLPKVKGARYCQRHLGDKRRCTGTVTERDEQGVATATRQCRKAALPGQDRCRDHGGGTGAQAAEVQQRSRAITAMQAFATPYDGDLSPISAFEREYRRTYGRILWIEEQIGQLEAATDLIWGRSKEEHTTAGEFPGTTTTYEAKLHGWEEMLRWERTHLLAMTKVWLAAKMDEAALNMQQRAIEYGYSLVTKMVVALGHDLADPETRSILGRVIEGERQIEQARRSSNADDLDG
jgi:hypothetical protein